MPRASRATKSKTPGFRLPVIFTRGPKVLQSALLSSPKEARRIPPPQAYRGTRWDGPSLQQLLRTGTEPEWRVFWALGVEGLWPDDDYYYQTAALGGRAQLGGAVLDFTLPFRAMAINVQGEFYHYRTTALAAKDVLLRARLAGLGIRLIFIDAEDALRRPRAIVKAALRGEDQSRLGRTA